MKTPTKELVQKLELVTSVINHSSFVPDFRNFHFNKEVLFASDGMVSIYTSSPLPEECFSVKADSFLNLLRNLSTEEVTLKIKDESLSVRTTKVEGKFTVGVPKECSYSIPSDAKGLESCPNLLEGLNLCRFGACKEKTSGEISGVRIDGDKIFSTDRFRIHKYSLENSSDLSPFTIPVKFIEVLLKNKEKIVQYGMDKDRFYVVLKDGTLIETVLFSGDFPKLEQYFESLDFSKFMEIQFKEDISKVLDKHLKSFLGDVEFFDKEVKFVINENTCVLYSESKSGGNLLEEVELEQIADSIEFVINPSLLQEVLTYSKGKFMYNIEDKVILLEADRLKVLIQTKV